MNSLCLRCVSPGGGEGGGGDARARQQRGAVRRCVSLPDLGKGESLLQASAVLRPCVSLPTCATRGPDFGETGARRALVADRTGGSRELVSHGKALHASRRDLVARGLFVHAIRYFSGHEGGYDEDSIRILSGTPVVFEAFGIGCRRRCAQEAVPDLLHDDPLRFVLKCQAVDAVRAGRTGGGSLCLRLLERELSRKKLAGSFRILEGLRLARRYACLKPGSLCYQDGTSLLHSRAFHQAEPDWRWLVLSAGVFDVNKTSLWGSTFSPLLSAVEHAADADAVAALLAAGADPNLASAAGVTPLGFAMLAEVPDGLAKLAVLLASPAIDPNRPSCFGHACCTPLHYGALQGLAPAVERLLTHPGTDPDRLFRVPYPQFSVSCASSLAVAVACCLGDEHYPLRIIQALAAAGARLLVVGEWGEGQQEALNCGDDLMLLQQVMGIVAAEDRRQGVTRALEAGRTQWQLRRVPQSMVRPASSSRQ